jgi:hypothetical protein
MNLRVPPSAVLHPDIDAARSALNRGGEDAKCRTLRRVVRKTWFARSRAGQGIP